MNKRDSLAKQFASLEGVYARLKSSRPTDVPTIPPPSDMTQSLLGSHKSVAGGNNKGSEGGSLRVQTGHAKLRRFLDTNQQHSQNENKANSESARVKRLFQDKYKFDRNVTDRTKQNQSASGSHKASGHTSSLRRSPETIRESEEVVNHSNPLFNIYSMWCKDHDRISPSITAESPKKSFREEDLVSGLGSISGVKSVERISEVKQRLLRLTAVVNPSKQLTQSETNIPRNSIDNGLSSLAFATFGVDAERIQDDDSNVSPQNNSPNTSLAPANLKKYINQLLLTKIQSHNPESGGLDSLYPHTLIKKSEQDTNEDTQLALECHGKPQDRSVSLREETDVERRNSDNTTSPTRLLQLRQQLTEIEKLGLESFNARRRCLSRSGKDNSVNDNTEHHIFGKNPKNDPHGTGQVNRKVERLSDASCDLKIKNRSVLGIKKDKERDSSANSREFSGFPLLDKAKSTTENSQLAGGKFGTPVLNDLWERKSLFMTTPEPKPVQNMNIKERKNLLLGMQIPDSIPVTVGFKPDIFYNQISNVLEGLHAPRASLSTGKAPRTLLQSRYQQADQDTSLILRPTSSMGGKPFGLDNSLWKDHVNNDAGKPTRQTSLQVHPNLRPSTPIKLKLLSPTKEIPREVNSASIIANLLSLSPERVTLQPMHPRPSRVETTGHPPGLPSSLRDISPLDLFRACRTHLNDFSHRLIKMQKDFNNKLQTSLNFDDNLLRPTVREPTKHGKSIQDIQRVSSTMSKAIHQYTGLLANNTLKHNELTDCLDQIEVEVRSLDNKQSKTSTRLVIVAAESAILCQLFTKFKKNSLFEDLENGFEVDDTFQKAKDLTEGKKDKLPEKLGMESLNRLKNVEESGLTESEGCLRHKKTPTSTDFKDSKLMGLVNSIRDKHKLQETEMRQQKPPKDDQINSEFRKVRLGNRLTKEIINKLTTEDGNADAQPTKVTANPKTIRTQKATIDQLLSGLRNKKDPRKRL